MAEQVLENYQGNCHCGAFKFSVKLPELKQVYACNCSICSKVLSFFAFGADYHSVLIEGFYRKAISGPVHRQMTCL